MKTVKIKSLHIQNFGNIKDLSINFGRKTLISGRNEAGKTTINDAYSWLMTNKLANGSQADGIRPHDRSGIEDDNAVISVSVVIEIDGAEKEFLKEQRKEFTQKTGKFKGNNNLYFINGVPKKEKEYKAYVEEKILEPDNLELCTNASVLLNMDTKKRRAVIFDMVPDITDADVAATDVRFANIPPKLDDCTLDELIQSVRYQINGRGRGDKGLKGRQDEFPARIDEAQRKVCDTAEYSLAINGLQKEIATLDEQEKSLDDLMAAYDQKSKNILDLKFEQSEIVRKANEGLVQQRKNIDSEIFSLEQDKKSAENDLRMAEMDLKHAKMGVERHTAEVKKAQEDYSRWISQKFDDSEIALIESEVLNEDSLICPTCGQAFPKERAEKIREDFEKNKALRIEGVKSAGRNYEEMKDREIQRVTESGNKAATDLKEAKKAQEEAEHKIAEIKKSISDLALKIAEKEKELSALPAEVDLSNDTEYTAISAQIEAAQKSIETMDNGSSARAEITEQRNAYIRESAKLAAEINKIQSDKAEHDRRVEELEEKLKAEGQKCADIEKNIDTLLNFSIEKNKALADMVNPYFKHFQFVFYDFTQEGGIYETLKIMCDGTDFFSGLNRSDQILCEIDLVCGLQKLNNLNLPVWVDNSEAVNAERLPEVEQQMIVLEVSGGDLKVEAM